MNHEEHEEHEEHEDKRNAMCCTKKRFGQALDRHSSAAWDPAFQQTAEELDPSLRWDDGFFTEAQLSMRSSELCDQADQRLLTSIFS